MHSFVEDDNLLKSFKGLKKFTIQIYQYHSIMLETRNVNDQRLMTVMLAISANLTNCKVILKIS